MATEAATLFRKHQEFESIMMMRTAFAVASPASNTDCNDFPALHLELRVTHRNVAACRSNLPATHFKSQ